MSSLAASATSDADSLFVGRIGEVHRDVPAPVAALERGDGGLAVVKTFVQEIGDLPRGLLVADGEGGAAGRRRNVSVIGGPALKRFRP